MSLVSVDDERLFLGVVMSLTTSILYCILLYHAALASVLQQPAQYVHAVGQQLIDPINNKSRTSYHSLVPKNTSLLSYRLANKDQHWWVADLQPLVVLSATPRSARTATLAIPYSFNRLNALRLQCASWTGVLAAAIYVPLVNGTLYAPGRPQHGWSQLMLAAWAGRVYNATQKQGRGDYH